MLLNGRKTITYSLTVTERLLVIQLLSFLITRCSKMSCCDQQAFGVLHKLFFENITVILSDHKVFKDECCDRQVFGVLHPLFLKQHLLEWFNLTRKLLSVELIIHRSFNRNCTWKKTIVLCVVLYSLKTLIYNWERWARWKTRSHLHRKWSLFTTHQVTSKKLCAQINIKNRSSNSQLKPMFSSFFITLTRSVQWQNTYSATHRIT